MEKSEEYKIFKIRSNKFHLPLSIVTHFNTDRPLYLGKGGYGVVGHLNSHDHTRFPDIVIKKFHDAFRSPKIAQRCYRELQLLSRIHHENIVKKMFAFSPDSSFNTLENVYLVTQYAGQDLETLIGNETLNRHFYYLKDFKLMLIQLLNALQFLNSAKAYNTVIHRDLKPQNIAVKRNGKLTLLDFGLARVIDNCREMTNSTGTIYYRAIETIAECDCRYDERADIWSVGAILCEMITGSVLFYDKNPLKKAISICGPVGEDILNQINDKQVRRYLEEKSKDTQRMNFVEYLEKYGRSWMKKELKKERDNLISFIDLTLQFDQSKRMTVNEALDHPFVNERGRQPFWSCIPITTQVHRSEIYRVTVEEVDVFSDEEELLFESSEAEINHWRECIWNHLNAIKNPFI